MIERNVISKKIKDVKFTSDGDLFIDGVKSEALVRDVKLNVHANFDFNNRTVEVERYVLDEDGNIIVLDDDAKTIIDVYVFEDKASTYSLQN